ncbi:hypothetical protein D9M71_276130 [compost metagenome]
MQEQAEEDQRQPASRRTDGGATAGLQRLLRLAQQMQGPALGGQRQRLPEVVAVAFRPVDPHPPAVRAERLHTAMLQRRQRLLVVLAGGGQFGALPGRQHAQLAVTPARPVGKKGDVLGVADQQHVRPGAPLALQIVQFEADHDGAEEAAVLVQHRAGKEVAGRAGDHPDRIETPGALAAGFQEVGAEAEVVADVAGRRPPVARRHRQPIAVEQLQGRRAGGGVDPLQLAVEVQLQLAAHRAAQRPAQFRIEGEYRRQGTVAVDQRAQGAGVEVQLLLGLRAGCSQSALLGLAQRHAGAQEHAGEDGQHGEGQAQRAGQGNHRAARKEAVVQGWQAISKAAIAIDRAAMRGITVTCEKRRHGLCLDMLERKRAQV